MRRPLGSSSEIIAKDGETVGAGALLGQIGDGAAAAPAKTGMDTEAKAAPKSEPKPIPVVPPPAEPAAVAPVMPASPAAAKIAADHGIDTPAVEGSGKRGQVLKGDVLAYIAKAPAPMPAPVPVPQAPVPAAEEIGEERVPMTRLRQTIARRLKDAQNTAAMLTTFNEADMSAIMALRCKPQGCLRTQAWRQTGLHGIFR